MEIPVIHEDETSMETILFINSNRRNQQPQKSLEELSKINLSDCKIYWRGAFLILEDHEGIIHYWDTPPKCYLKQAVDFMQIEKPAAWKTIDKLISLRMGIRQTEVNCMGYVDTILVGKNMTHSLYKEFMQLARKQDLQHHGEHTF